MAQKEHCVTNNAISSRLLTSHPHNFAIIYGRNKNGGLIFVSDFMVSSHLQ